MGRRVNLKSGGRRAGFVQMWGYIHLIHIIHSPYYYYESIIILIYQLNLLWYSCTIHK